MTGLTDEYITVDQLADYLMVPKATIYVWRRDRKGPPGVRVGRHLRFRTSDVEAWLEGLRTKDEERRA